MSDYLDLPDLKVTNAKYLSQVSVTAITRMKYSGESNKLLGLFHYQIDYVSKDKKNSVQILIKSKTHYRELIQRLATVLDHSGIDLPNLPDLLMKTEFYNTHMKEINIFRMQKTNTRMAKILPKVYGYYVDDLREDYMVLEEFLDDAYLIQDYTDISFWSEEMIACVISGFAQMHAAFYGNYQPLIAQGWLGATMNNQIMKELTPL